MLRKLTASLQRVGRQGQKPSRNDELFALFNLEPNVMRARSAQLDEATAVFACSYSVWPTQVSDVLEFRADLTCHLSPPFPSPRSHRRAEASPRGRRGGVSASGVLTLRSAFRARGTPVIMTSDYFERLAQKEARDPDRRQRLLEVAGFYRSLARIIPGIPTGYKGNGAALPVTRAERWKARAEECRTLADCFTDPICRGQLTRLAQGYDQMAVAAE